MSFVDPKISFYIYTGLDSEQELVELLGMAPDDAWTMNEDSEYFETEIGETLYYVDGPHSTGVRFDSPLNDDSSAHYDARIKALLDRLDPVVAPLALLRKSHSYPYGTMEVVMRIQGENGPNSTGGFGLDSEDINRLIALGADVCADFTFTPFDPCDGRRYRPRRAHRRLENT